MLSSSSLVYALALGLPLLLLLHRRRRHSALVVAAPEQPATDGKATIMQQPRDDLDPPRHDPLTLAELARYDGADDGTPVYVSIKGDVFDVSRKRDVYGRGGTYHVFAGRDASRGLGMSSLVPADAVPDYSTLAANEMKVLDDWHAFFSKRYNIVGRVADMPEAVAHLMAEEAS